MIINFGNSSVLPKMLQERRLKFLILPQKSTLNHTFSRVLLQLLSVSTAQKGCLFALVVEDSLQVLYVGTKS